jgi:hypothetical protein
MYVPERGHNHDCHERRTCQMGRVRNRSWLRILKSLILPLLRRSGSLERRIDHRTNTLTTTIADQGSMSPNLFRKLLQRHPKRLLWMLACCLVALCRSPCYPLYRRRLRWRSYIIHILRHTTICRTYFHSTFTPHRLPLHRRNCKCKLVHTPSISPRHSHRRVLALTGSRSRTLAMGSGAQVGRATA